MIETLNQYDHSLMLWLNYDGGTFLDVFWKNVSSTIAWMAFYLELLCAFKRHAVSVRHLVILIAFTALIILAADQISSGLIKPWVQRPRPSHQPGVMEWLHYVGDYRGGPFGFVSSHAANTLALAVWISLLFRQTPIYFAMGIYYLANCYSRIYLGVHYPGDIICGSLIGALCGWAGFMAYRRCCHSGLHLTGDSGIVFSRAEHSIPIALFASLLAFAAIALYYAV